MQEMSHQANKGHYGKLIIMALLSFASMYVLMYAMVDRLGNVVPNRNQLYMAGLMTAPMVLFELWVMRGMFPNRGRNVAISGVALAALLGFFFVIREQSAVSDKQFLKSMIPHHAGAILMCEEAAIREPEVKALCDQITKSQLEEIAQMKALLKKFDSKG